MRKNNRMLGVLATGFLLAGLGSVTQAPESHAASSHCPTAYACIWKDKDYSTTGSGNGWVAFQYSIVNYSGWYYNGFAHTGSYSADNSATSIFNQGVTSTACWYKLANYSGTQTCMTRGSGRNNLATSVSPIGFNDVIVISSGRFV